MAIYRPKLPMGRQLSLPREVTLRDGVLPRGRHTGRVIPSARWFRSQEIRWFDPVNIVGQIWGPDTARWFRAVRQPRRKYGTSMDRPLVAEPTYKHLGRVCAPRNLTSRNSHG